MANSGIDDEEERAVFLVVTRLIRREERSIKMVLELSIWIFFWVKVRIEFSLETEDIASDCSERKEGVERKLKYSGF